MHAYVHMCDIIGYPPMGQPFAIEIIMLNMYVHVCLHGHHPRLHPPTHYPKGRTPISVKIQIILN